MDHSYMRALSPSVLYTPWKLSFLTDDTKADSCNITRASVSSRNTQLHPLSSQSRPNLTLQHFFFLRNVKEWGKKI